MSNYKLTIAYDGTRYNGWQKQGNTDKTIQGKIEAVAERFAGMPTEVHGAGRTDAGVHAKGQTANVRIPRKCSEDELLSYFNEYLPEDIQVLAVTEADERFHARLSAVKKHYRYYINNAEYPDIFRRRYETHIPGKLDILSMRGAAEYFVGEHDFSSFCSNRHMKKSKVRTLYEVNVTQSGDRILLDFWGDGFLYNMVRIMSGTLIEVGEGKRKPQETEDILIRKDRQAAGITAPPQGLFLMEVLYD